MDRVEPRRVESPPDGPRVERREGHRGDAARHRCACAVLGNDRRGEPVAGVGRDRWHEDAVLVLSDPRERAGQLARVRLRSADEPRHERQQAQARPASRERTWPNGAVTRPGYDDPMPDRGREGGASAQVLPPVEADPVALFAQLQEELRRGGTDGSHARVAWRAQAERMWAVSAERPLVRRPGLKGAVAYPVKRLLRPLLRWYVEPLAAEQRAYNDAVLKLIDDL